MLPRSRAPNLLLTFLFLLAGAWPADATVLRRATLDEMTRGADVIVLATVREVSEHVAAPGRRLPVTTTVLDLQHVLKGGEHGLPARGFKLQQIGGQAGGLIARIPGMPRFEVGQRVVLFLERTPRGGWTVLGFEQGRFVVETDAEGAAVAVRTVRGVGVLDPRSGDIAEGTEENLRVPLPALFDAIRRTLAAEEVAR